MSFQEGSDKDGVPRATGNRAVGRRGEHAALVPGRGLLRGANGSRVLGCQHETDVLTPARGGVPLRGIGRAPDQNRQPGPEPDWPPSL